MTVVKRITDLTNYTTVLPYASELFGIYQPLIGWKSKRIIERYQKGLENDKAAILNRLKSRFAGLVDITYKDNSQVQIDLKPGALEAGKLRSFDSILLQQISQKLPDYSKYHPGVWNELITKDNINTILKKDVTKIYSDVLVDLTRADTSILGNAPILSRETVGATHGHDANEGSINDAMRDMINTTSVVRTNIYDENLKKIEMGSLYHQLQYESSIGGTLLYLVEQKSPQLLEEIFYATQNNAEQAKSLIKMVTAKTSGETFFDLDHFNPRDKEFLNSVVLSPISVVHLFRQYFFELDTFLGTPISHVWLSPGSTVELIEVQTRKTTVEKTLETTIETINKAESTTTDQDEISDAVKEQNQQDINFGASVKASYASIEATSSFDFKNSQQMAREETHKHMRQQTDKLSSEIRKNYKATFKTVTEFTDLSSVKHVLANPTQELINYELRRKMRQVGVQVQDIGTYLCWQTYVDDPGRDLGLSKLIHIAKPPELDSIPHPEEIPMLQAFQEEKIVTIPFISIDGTNADNEDEVYLDGVEVDNSEWWGTLEKIQSDFPQEFVCPKSNFNLTNVEFDPQGKPVDVARKGSIQNINGKATFILHLHSADFQGQNSIQVKLILHWAPAPGANDAIIQKNNENLAAFKEKEKAEYEKAYVENVKERVKLASKITSRNSDELREEERIVVYRKLIQDMLLNQVPLVDDRTRHMVAELINSIFDVDKMLYFVAPEWWRPRLHRSRQQLTETPPHPKFDNSVIVGTSAGAVLKSGFLYKMYHTELNATSNPMSASSVGWGGINDVERDNYYITEDSDPAKFGSSLGWLMQLDGDNMRNAFLNAPWVKAVIPIRPGKEEAAINWLKGVEGMNGITDDVVYHASNPNEKDINGQPLDGQKMIDVLNDLAKKIRKKYLEGVETGKYPKQDEVSDPNLVDDENTVTATPIDRVYEHGFFPLQGGFRANVGKNYEIFDQWIEILPTDQIVPVQVKYDPKTGRQVDD